MAVSNATEQQKREKPDPHEASLPVPIFVLALFAVLFVWGVYYIWSVRPLQPAHYGDHRTLEDLAGKPKSKSGAVDGAGIYTARCVACHQATGTGMPGVFPPLAKAEWVLGLDKVLVQILLHGVQGKLTVDGTAYNGLMPAFKDLMNDEEIAAAASYIRSQWGNSAAAIPASKVAEERAATASRSQPFNGDEELAALKNVRSETPAKAQAPKKVSKQEPIPSIRYPSHISAAHSPPQSGVLTNPYKGNRAMAAAGAGLFSSMNCDGCHGGGAAGFAAPSLADGRWRYGRADEEIFQSIFYGRPKGMPAFGGVMGSDGIWILVTYLKSLPVPDNATQSWETK